MTSCGRRSCSMLLDSDRNHIVHAYFDIDLDVVWSTVEHAVPDMLSKLEALLEEPRD